MKRFDFGKKKLKKGLIPFAGVGIESLFGIDNLFKGFFEAPLGLSLFKGYKEPALDVYEKGSQLIVKAELPGMDKKDINISVDNDVLTISGTRKIERELKKENYYHVERSYGSISRSIRLPEGVKEQDIKASYKDGVLTITLQKSEKVQHGKKIDIE